MLSQRPTTTNGSPRGWPDEPLARLTDLVRRHGGRDISLLDVAFLERSLERRMAATTSAGPDAYLERLLGDPVERRDFLESLDIHHSELFRDPLLFALLEDRILPGLALQREGSGGSELRIWSAGCASGQEAYSLAILLTELAEASNGPVRFRIIATDASEQQLELARRGVFGETSMRNVRLRHLERWFVRRGSEFVVDGGLRSFLDFSAYDLLDPDLSSPPASIFGEFDLVLCCNVLYYYRPDAQRLLVDKLRSCLSDEGFLATGSAERGAVLASGAFQATSMSSPLFTRWR